MEWRTRTEPTTFGFRGPEDILGLTLGIIMFVYTAEGQRTQKEAVLGDLGKVGVPVVLISIDP